MTPPLQLNVGTGRFPAKTVERVRGREPVVIMPASENPVGRG